MRRRVLYICRALAESYGSPRLGNKRDPLNELVFILLSQKTGRWSYEEAYRSLRRTCPSWGMVRDAPTETVAAAIKPAGLSNNRTARIKAILARLTEDFGRPTLAPLRRVSTEDAEAYLTSLPGVGEKTAKCVLMYSLDREVLPVDTHVKRIATRLGLIAEGASDREAHAALEEAVPPELRFGFHVNGVCHGREVCTKHQPRCSSCCVRKLCPFPATA
jgi:endonuclease III